MAKAVDDEFLTIAEAAAVLGVPISTIVSGSRAARLLPTILGKSRRRFIDVLPLR